MNPAQPPAHIITLRIISLTVATITAAAALFSAAASAAAEQRADPNAPAHRFVQISDPHVPVTAQATNEIYPFEALQKVVAEIMQLDPLPAFALVTGDIAAKNGEPAAYRRFRTAMKALAIPWYVVAGNHDSRAVLREKFSNKYMPHEGPLQYRFSAPAFEVLVLDSLLDGEIAGELGPARRRWLQDSLRDSSESPALVVLHHHVLKVGMPSDKYILNDRDAFWDAIYSSPQVKAVLHGHIHRPLGRCKGAIAVIGGRSASYAFEEQWNTPGYMRFDVYKDGKTIVYDVPLNQKARRIITFGDGCKVHDR